MITIPMNDSSKNPGSPICSILSKAAMAGHSYLLIDQLLLALCGSCGVDSQDAHVLLELARADGKITLEENRVYLSKNHHAEVILADFISDALGRPPMPTPLVGPFSGGIKLSEEQRRAVSLALSCRLSLITGGAGTGKSCILRSVADFSGDPSGCLFCAPTGKAAQNVKDNTGYPAVTVHSALGAVWDADLTQPKRDLSMYHTIIVDEASMLTLEMMAGLVKAASDNCRFMLTGDSKQLLPVGCGNLLADLDQLGVPRANLTQVFRQSDRESALYENVTRFGSITESSMFREGNSFICIPTEETEIKDMLLKLAVPIFRASRSSVILTPRTDLENLDVKSYNMAMQATLQTADMPHFNVGEQVYYDRDRVIFSQNNRGEGYINGTAGILGHSFDEFGEICWHVQLPDGARIPLTEQAKKHLALAYSMTVHKCQGSSFQTVLMPLSMQFARQMTRNMLYTALTRAKKQVILVGNPMVLDAALQRLPLPRNLTLVQRVQQKLTNSAA